MLSGVRTEVRPGQDVGVSACSESTQPRMTATEAFSFAASFESIFISQSFISDFLSQRLLTELFESIVSPGLALPRFEIHPPLMQRCNRYTKILFCATAGTANSSSQCEGLDICLSGGMVTSGCVCLGRCMGSVLAYKGWDALHFAH